MTVHGWTAFATSFAALWACVWNVWASYEAPRPWSRIYGVTAIYAAFWTAAYGWVAFSETTSRSEWSQTVTPVALSGFFFVWAAPAMITSVVRRRERKARQRLTGG